MRCAEGTEVIEEKQCNKILFKIEAVSDRDRLETRQEVFGKHTNLVDQELVNKLESTDE